MKNLKVKQVSETKEILEKYKADENVIKNGLKLVIATDEDNDGIHILSLIHI